MVGVPQLVKLESIFCWTRDESWNGFIADTPTRKSVKRRILRKRRWNGGIGQQWRGWGGGRTMARESLQKVNV